MIALWTVAKRSWRFRAGLIGGTTALLSLNLLISGWRYWWNQAPTISVPPRPPAPNLNGFDVLRNASATLTHTDIIDGYGSHAPSLPESRHGKPISPAEESAAVAANQAALTATRRSLTLPFVSPAQRTVDSNLTPLAHFREAVRLLSLEGHVHEARGEYDAAAQSRLDAMQLGADQIPHGGALISYLVGIACEAIGSRPLWSLSEKLTAPEARAAALRLEQIDSRRILIADAITEEKWATEAGIARLFLAPDKNIGTALLAVTSGKDSAAAGSAPEGKLLSWQEQVHQGLCTLTTSKAQVIQHYDTYMTTLAARARLPYTAALPLPVVPEDSINASICQDFDSARLKAADQQTKDSLLTTVLALRAYCVEHGAYPDSLIPLITDGYLTRIPIDPFDPARSPVRYRRTNSDRYLLYSVGPDGRDDNGHAIDNPDTNGKQKRWVEKGAQGDYVVGVNLY